MADDEPPDEESTHTPRAKPTREAVVLSIAGRMPRQDKGEPGKDPVVRASRITQAWTLRMAGATWDAVADQCGYNSGGAARSAVIRAAERVTAETVEEFREVENARYDRLQLALWSRALEGDLAAFDRVLKIMDQRARLNGLNQPVQVQVNPAGSDVLAWVKEVLALQEAPQAADVIEADVVDAGWTEDDDPTD